MREGLDRALGILVLVHQVAQQHPGLVATGIKPQRQAQIGLGELNLALAGEGGRAGDQAFRRALADIPEIVDFYRMSGEIDYLIRAVVPDIEAYDGVYKRLISAVDLTDVTSMFAMEELKSTTEVPLDYAAEA